MAALPIKPVSNTLLIMWKNLKKEVEAAVDKGLSLEQTKAAVTMKVTIKVMCFSIGCTTILTCLMPTKTLAITRTNNQ
jgi:hypothetical protein